MEYNNEFVSTILGFGSGWTVKISDELLAELSNMVGAENVNLDFPGKVNL